MITTIIDEPQIVFPSSNRSELVISLIFAYIAVDASASCPMYVPLPCALINPLLFMLPFNNDPAVVHMHNLANAWGAPAADPLYLHRSIGRDIPYHTLHLRLETMARIENTRNTALAKIPTNRNIHQSNLTSMRALQGTIKATATCTDTEQQFELLRAYNGCHQATEPEHRNTPICNVRQGSLNRNASVINLSLFLQTDRLALLCDLKFRVYASLIQLSIHHSLHLDRQAPPHSFHTTKSFPPSSSSTKPNLPNPRKRTRHPKCTPPTSSPS